MTRYTRDTANLNECYNNDTANYDICYRSDTAMMFVMEVILQTKMFYNDTANCDLCYKSSIANGDVCYRSDTVNYDECYKSDTANCMCAIKVTHQTKRSVSKVSVLIFYLNVYWTHLKLQVISFKV